MARVVFVLGLCGAGKSTRADELAAAGFANFDEKAAGRSLDPEWPGSANADFLAAVANGRDCVVTDVYFFQPDAQHRVARDLEVSQPGVVIEWECLIRRTSSWRTTNLIR